jgi:hypothetical protein
MGAIRILQERSLNKPKVKVEYAQPAEISVHVTPPPDSAKYPPVVEIPVPVEITYDSPKPPAPSPSSMIIKPTTHVYAVWSDDDGLVYEVCSSKDLLRF